MAMYTCYAMTLEESIGDVYTYPSVDSILTGDGILDNLVNPRYKLVVKHGSVSIYHYNSMIRIGTVDSIEDVPGKVRKAFPCSWFFTIDGYEPVDGVSWMRAGTYHIISKEKVNPIEFMFAHKDECN